MTTPASNPTPAGREHISCPGCGRHDWVSWPAAQDSYAWTCFNCGKAFELQRGGKH